MSAADNSTLDPSEVEKFSQLAAEWWDPNGKFAVLHRFNPVRLAYIKDQLCGRFARDPFARAPLQGLRLLDIGCGGGLLSEPMARLGATVTAIDPSEKNIATAKVHAGEQELSIDYRAGLADDIERGGESFDVILAMEVIEHVADPAAFTALCASLLKPGGLVFFATLNRTFKSFALAIIGAEYVLGWLPKGTHQWEKFITPAELEQWMKVGCLVILDRQGIGYNPLSGEWRRVRDMDVNYMMLGRKEII
jgi:2-polyprenyl-6-hydroxyphenyl methylase / 3-demethylubiquinone-9 3-methyltransferase